MQYTLKTLEELESEAISIEARLQKMPSGSDVDMLALSATLTGNRTKLVTLHTQAEAQKGRIDRYMTERRKRIAELKRYQALLVDLEQWLGEAQATISMEIKLTSAKVVRDQIRASEVRVWPGQTFSANLLFSEFRARFTFPFYTARASTEGDSETSRIRRCSTTCYRHDFKPWILALCNGGCPAMSGT